MVPIQKAGLNPNHPRGSFGGQNQPRSVMQSQKSGLGLRLADSSRSGYADSTSSAGGPPSPTLVSAEHSLNDEEYPELGEGSTNSSAAAGNSGSPRMAPQKGGRRGPAAEAFSIVQTEDIASTSPSRNAPVIRKIHNRAGEEDDLPRRASAKGDIKGSARGQPGGYTVEKKSRGNQDRLLEKQMMCTSVEDQPDLGQVIEDNILALLDTIGVKHTDDIEDDKISFIEAVSALCIAGKQPKAPTWRVHEAIFQILEGNDSKVLNLASYSLLVEISQQYPHMMVGEDTANGMKKVIIVNNKIWCPFHADPGVEDKCKGGISTRQANPTQTFCEEFFSLLEDIKGKIGEKPWAASTDVESEEDLESTNYKVIGLMLKFKYLFSILEYDFKCRFEVYKDGKKKEIISSSYLVQLFEETRRKPLVELLLNLIASTGVSTNRGKEVLHLQEFSSSIQALLEMRLSLELESVRTINTSPRKARQDAPRSQPIFELVNEIVYYNKRMFEYLLQAMEDTDCKLRIIFYNFIKDIPKPLTREKIRDPDNMTVQDLLNCLKEVTAARKVFNCIESNILQVLLASAFKVGLRHTSSDGISTGTLEMCKLLKTAFKNLQTISNEFVELHSAARQALITAEALIMLAN